MKEFILKMRGKISKAIGVCQRAVSRFQSERNARILKAVVVSLLALVVGISIYRGWEDLYYIEWPQEDCVPEEVLDYLSEERTVVQRFRAGDGHIYSIGVLLATYGTHIDSGKLVFVFSDAKGKLLYKETVDAAKLQDNKYYEFKVDRTVEKGRYYSFEITASGYGDSPGPSVWIGEQRDSASTLTFLDKPLKAEVLYRLSFLKFQPVPIILSLLMLAVIALLCFWRFTFKKTVGNVLGGVFLLTAPCVSFYLVESLYQNPFNKDFYMVFFNYLIYLGIYLICLLAVGSFRWAVFIGNTLTFVLGLVNYFVIEFRGVPVCPWDIFSIGTAAEVVDGYSLHFDLELISRLLCMLAVDLFALHFAKQKFNKLARRATGLGTVAYVFIVLHLLVGTTLLEENGFEPDMWSHRTGYLNNGFFLSFVMNTRYIQVEEPENYQAEAVEEILQDYGGKTQKQYADIRPNIIMVMNEAYSDLSVVNKFQTNIDYSPLVNHLTENTVKGNLYVSIFGGGTCNTEYEVLTGNTMAFLAPGSIAYQQYINRSYKTGGLAMALGGQGYTCYAIHPLDGSNWNRENVYQSMGFDAFYDLASFPKDAEQIRSSFISDLESYRKIIKLYEEKEEGKPIFIFDVTVQNHGGYETKSVFEEPVTIENMEGDYPKAEEYLSLIKMSDDAFGYLLYYFSQEAEPTMIVMFGDHQPAIEDEFYEELYGKSLEDLDLEELQRRYEVPFIIWTNYEIEEAVVEGMSANYLPGLLLSYTGIPIPKYFAYQNEMYQELPVINANGYRDKEGNDYTFSEESEYGKWLEEYRILHYNSALDRENTWLSMYSAVDTADKNGETVEK